MLAWKRAVLVALLPAVPLLCGCAVAFEKALTPSGEPCTDMPIFTAGQTIERPYHRIKPVATPLKPMTEAERLEALRREACKLQADAVIEASREEAQLPDHTHVERASGTAVVWRRAATKPTPLSPAVTSPSPTSGPVPSSTGPGEPAAPSTGHAEPEESSTTPEPAKTEEEGSKKKKR